MGFASLNPSYGAAGEARVLDSARGTSRDVHGLNLFLHFMNTVQNLS
jgi:hypothetical protein